MLLLHADMLRFDACHADYFVAADIYASRCFRFTTRYAAGTYDFHDCFDACCRFRHALC